MNFALHTTMKTLSPFILFAFVVSAGFLAAEARRDPGEYWDAMMNGDPMPKAITDLLFVNQDPSSSSSSPKDRLFIRDFDIKPNLIIYHSHVDVYPKKHEVVAKDVQQKKT